MTPPPPTQNHLLPRPTRPRHPPPPSPPPSRPRPFRHPPRCEGQKREKGKKKEKKRAALSTEVELGRQCGEKTRHFFLLLNREFTSLSHNAALAALCAIFIDRKTRAGCIGYSQGSLATLIYRWKQSCTAGPLRKLWRLTGGWEPGMGVGDWGGGRGAHSIAVVFALLYFHPVFSLCPPPPPDPLPVSLLLVFVV